MKISQNIVVVDIESTCDKDNNTISIQDGETIEIGAVAISSLSGDVISEFVSFVRPVINPKLTQFCIDLTGITQTDIDSVESFSYIWSNKFIPWLSGVREFCSWGRYDLEQFHRDCKRNNLPDYFERHCDVSKIAGKNKRLVMKRLGVKPYGRPHRGLIDAKNVASILAKLLVREVKIVFRDIKIL